MSKLIDQLDLIVLVAILALGAWVVTSGIGTGAQRGEEARRELVAARGDLETRLDENHFPETELAAEMAEFEAMGAGIEASWDKALPGAAREFEPTWAHHAGVLADLRDGVSAEVKLGAPQNLILTADVGLIRLGWERGTESTVDPVAFVIFRRDGSGERKRLTEVPGEETSYEDRDVVPGVLYGYDVVARSADPVLLAQGRGNSPASRGAQVRARRDYEISPRSWKDSRAIFRVRKFANGTWHERDFELAQGGAIGQGEAAGGVDFRTNCRLEDVNVATEMIQVERDEVVLNAEGKVEIDPEAGPKTIRKIYERPREVVTFTIRNEVGQRETLTLTL